MPPPRVAVLRDRVAVERWIERELKPWYEQRFGKPFTRLDAAALGPDGDWELVAEAEERAREMLFDLAELVANARGLVDRIHPASGRGASIILLERFLASIGPNALPRPTTNKAARRAMFPPIAASLHRLVQELDLRAAIDGSSRLGNADVARISLLAGYRPARLVDRKPFEIVDDLANKVKESRAATRRWHEWQARASERARKAPRTNLRRTRS